MVFFEFTKRGNNVPSTLSVTGDFKDLKNAVSFSADIELTESKYTVYSFLVEIELKSSSTKAEYDSFELKENIYPRNSDTDLRLARQFIGIASDPRSNQSYNFTNLTSYKIMYTCVIQDTSNPDENTNNHYFTHIRYFTYYATPVELTDFTFDPNIGESDPIHISGLTLDHGSNGSSDTTVPYGARAIEFTFQEAEIPTEIVSGDNNQEINAVYSRFFTYNPNGVYELPANTLTAGKIYRVNARANWELGYSTSVRATNSVYVIKRPEISAVSVKSLYVDNSNNVVIDISLNELVSSGSFIVPSKFWFEFYNSTDTKVAVAGGVNGLNLVNTVGGYNYTLKLSDIALVNGTNGLENGIAYTLKAKVKYDGYLELPETPQYRFSNPVDVSFNLVRPVINSITPYDVQNDGGDDGFGVDSSTQIVATMTVDKGQYQLYAPNGLLGIKFKIYNSLETTLLATTSSYTFVNNSNNATYNYNILLSEITPVSGQLALVNGTEYKVKAEVTLVDHSGDTETRESDNFTSMTFSQNVAHVIDLKNSNTRALATDDNPSSSSTRFNASPPIGISGHFKKNAQFNSVYTKHLDTEYTKFKLEYRVKDYDNNDTDPWGSWLPVKKAVLIQGLSGEILAVAVNRALGVALVSSADGKYDNVPDSGSVVGTSQPEMVFYIPQEQETGANAFTEYNKVEVRVTVIDTAELWEGSYEASSDSNTLQLINKIADYAFVVGDLTEPYNTQDISGNLSLNIPVSWASIHGDSVIVKHGYSSGNLNTTTTANYPDTYVTISVNPNSGPNSGTTLYYTVQYVVDNVNLGVSQTTAGLTSAEQNVPNKFFPEDSDYSITSTSYKTFNTGGESSIAFTLDVSANPLNRIDGVNVYFESPDSDEGSDIAAVRIGTYLFSATGSKTIQILDALGVYFQKLDASGNIAPVPNTWGDFDLANISFKAYRDRRVISYDASYNTLNYVESGVDTTSFNPVWNVPLLQSPSADGEVILEGGVRNSSATTKLSWTQTQTDNQNNFTYDLTMQKDSNPTLIHDDTDLSGNNYDLSITTTANAQYIVTLRKVFYPSTTGAIREVSDPVDTITFHTIHVDVSGVNIQVQDPSNIVKVNLSWNEPVVTGDSFDLSGNDVSSSFADNIDSHYIKYLLTSDPSNNLIRLDQDPSGNLIERIISPATKNEYDLPVQSLGTTYQFYMYIEALIRYKVNSTIKSTVAVEISDQTTTSSDSQYIVSSIPSIGLPSTTPVLIDGQSNPTLLLNLNANGLEDEGFISVVVILTQDGTADKPEGEQALLVFPDTSSNFVYNNTLLGSGAGNPPYRLAGNESATSAPRNLSNASMSTQNNTYTLTIGTVGSNGRYGYSTLNMPSSTDSGFVSSGSPSSASYNPINYMVILTTRRGTDIEVGKFEYQSFPAVQNVTITTSGGQYYVNFDINNV